MGATNFMVQSEGKTAQEAFDEAVKEAQYEYGHRGYTGTIAEKQRFVSIQCPQGKDPRQYADELMEANDKRIENKWGPAGCIYLGENKYLFFGYASC